MSERQPTQEQTRAIETLDRHVFVSAGAGTGKTYVLTEHYMQILRSRRASVSEILAITFTEKAASEMRGRIRDSCEEAAGTAADAGFWRKIKHDLDGARIGTIHGMCSSILKEHPLQAGCDPGFHVIDEGGNTILIKEAVGSAIESMLTNEDADLRLLIAEYGLSGVARILSHLLSDEENFNRASAFFDSRKDDELIALWETEFEKIRRAAIAEILDSMQWRQKEVVLRNSCASDPSDTLERKRADIVSLIDSMKESVAADAQLGLVGQILKIRAGGGSTAKWDKEEMMKQVSKTISSAKDILKKKLSLFLDCKEDSGHTLKLGRALNSVCTRCLNAFRELKKKRGGLGFDDLQIKVRDLLARDESLRKSIRRRTKFILVDEFQDISPIQKEIIFALAGRHEPEEGTPAHLMVVGDAKQSIYRFRGADVTVFNTLRDSMTEDGDAEIIGIDRNFRSAANLVSFFNGIFTPVMPPLDEAPPWYAAYEAASAHKTSAGQSNCAELLIANFDKDHGKADAASQRIFEAEMVARRIRELVDGGEYKYGDIAVLLRKFADRSPIFERAFREYDIRYHITAGSGFYGREEITDLLNVLRIAENPLDDFALLSVLRSPMFALDDNTLFRIGRSGGARFWDKFVEFSSPEELPEGQAAGLEHARKTLLSLSRRAQDATLSGFFTEALEATDYEAVLLSTFMGEQKVSNVRKLVDVARRFEESGVLAPGDFVDYVNELVTNEIRESEAVAAEEKGDAVRLMTIHKAKGLEFPVVFLPAVSEKRGKTGTSKCVADPELGLIMRSVNGADGGKSISRAGIVWEFRNKLQEDAEELRVLYVGATRAEDLLVLTATIGKGKTDGDSWLGKIFAALDVPLEPGEREIQLPPDENGVSAGMRVCITDAAQTTPAPVQNAHGEDRALVPVSQALYALSKEEPAGISPMLAGLDADTSAKKGFSATELAIYDYCPRKYYYQTICGYAEQYGEQESSAEGRAPSPTKFGTIAHEVFEKLDFRTPPPREKIMEIIRKNAFLDGKTKEKTADEIENVVGIFLETPLCKELRNAKGVERELPFLMRLNGAGIEGIIDLLYERDDGTVCIVDYKSSKVPDGDFAGEARGYETQLAAYALAANRILKKPIAPPRIYFMRQGRLEDVMTGGEPEQRLERIIENIRNGRFDRKDESTECRCGFARLCRKDDKANGDCH